MTGRTCTWLVLLALTGCTPTARIEHQVEPIRVEPIHITVDVNVRVDERLDRFFEFEEDLETAPPPVAPQEVMP